MRMNWFRLYHEARNDAKLRTLSDAQHRVWFSLLCLASEQRDRGTIEDYDKDLLSIEVASGDDELLAATLKQLQRLRIITNDGTTIGFCNFMERQYDKPSDRPEAVKERVTKHRELLNKEGVTPSNAVKRDETHIQEERRVEEIIGEGEDENAAASKPPPPTPISSRTSKRATAGHPIPPDFGISPTMKAKARAEGWGNWVDLDKHTRRFIDYWTIGEGAGRCKKNWELTWQNWIDDEAQKAQARGQSHIGGNNGAIRNGIGRVQVQETAERSGNTSYVPGLADEVARLSSETKGA